MIRINLNRSRVASGSGDESAALHIEEAGRGSVNAREAIVKMLLVCLGTIGLMLYERQNLDTLSQQAAAVGGQLQQVRSQVTAKTAELAQLKDIEPQAQALNDKMKILKELSRLRLEELQALDFLQVVIPERVWLRSIEYDKKHFQMFGNAVETVDLTEFVNKLEGSAYFTDVIVIQDRDKQQGTTKIRDFELTAQGGIKN